MKICFTAILLYTYATITFGESWAANLLPSSHLLHHPYPDRTALHKSLPYNSHLYEYPIVPDGTRVARYAPYASEDTADPGGHLTEQDRADIAYIEELTRSKRSGSGDILGSLKSSIGQGIKSKIGMLASGSKHVSSHFSGGSGGGVSHYDDHHYHDKHFDLWSLKKHIFFTLLQAAKAINGLVLAGKGHLLKGGGYLVTGGGRLITAKGEALKNWGKAIASSALLSPHKTHSSVVEYHPHHQPLAHHTSTGYGISHAPVHHHHHTVTGVLIGPGGGGSHAHGSRPSLSHHGDYISSPSAPGPNFEDFSSHVPVGPSSFLPGKYFATTHEAKHHHGKPPVAHSGLVILKKIPPPEHIHHHEHHHEHGEDHSHDHDHDSPPIHPPNHEHPNSHHYNHEHSDIHAHGHDYPDLHHYEDTGHHQHDVPDFKPIGASILHNVLPSVKNILSSVFSASSVHGLGHNDQPSDSDILVDYPLGAEGYTHADHNSEYGNYIGAHSTRHEEKVPSSISYGTPLGPSVDYKQYFNTKDNSVNNVKIKENFVTEQPINTANYVTPIQTDAGLGYPLPIIAPTAEQFKIEVLDPTQSTDPLTIKSQPQLYIGMNLPLNSGELLNIKDFPAFPVTLPNEYVAKYFQQHLNNQVVPTINSLQLQEPRHLDLSSSSLNSLLNAGSKVTRKAPSYTSKQTSTKTMKSPTIDIVRSVAFELGSNVPARL